MNTTARKLATKNVSPWVNNVLKIVLPQTNRRQRRGARHCSFRSSAVNLPLHAAAAPRRAFEEPLADDRRCSTCLFDELREEVNDGLYRRA
jgi:hypothetical protein